jgi:2-polyprenyl-3-methyl-5-hydroxy-6-metoxy-1,4-benzoquinol methylase
MDLAEKELQENFTWSRTEFHSEYNAHLAKYKVMSCLNYAKGTHLLDIACGDGLMTEMFAKNFDYVVGVDANGDHLAKAKERLPEVTFFECLIEEFNTEDRFDTITMLDLLEHVQDPVAVLQKAASFLKDDGILIVHVPNSQAVNRKLAVLMGTLESCEELTPFDLKIAGHRRSYSLETLANDVTSAGLSLVDTGGIFYKSLSTAQMDWFLKEGLWEGENFGWGRVGGPQKDWKEEFCMASYELGKERPDDCNIIFACITVDN